MLQGNFWPTGNCISPWRHINFSRETLSRVKIQLGDISVQYSVLEVSFSILTSGKLVVTPMPAFSTVSDPELRRKADNLPVCVTRMPHLVLPICYNRVFQLLGFSDLSKEYSNTVQNAVKSCKNKAEIKHSCHPFEIPLWAYWQG